MRTVIYEKYGGPEVLKIVDSPTPSIKENEILVKVTATTVTIADVRLRKADPWAVKLMNGFPSPRNKVLGQEFSGTVEAIGGAVTKFKVGDEVFGTTGMKMKTHAEYITIPETGTVLLKPENIDHPTAASAPFGAMTSLHFLRKGKTGPGKKILIYGASGNLGSAAVQLAVALGADVYGVCSGRNRELVSSLGASMVIDYEAESIGNFTDHFDIIYDTAGKSPFDLSVRALKKGGYYLRAVHFAPRVVFQGVFENLKGKVKVVGGTYFDSLAELEHICDLLSAGKLKPVIDSRFPLSRIADAHRLAESGHKRGSVVVLPSE